MVNRNKLIDLFISNITNVILHKILERAIDKQEIVEKYNKEIKNSWGIAKNYREKINPVNSPLPEKDIGEIKRRITNKVKTELRIRIKRGYTNINLALIEEFVEQTLKEMMIV